MSINHPEGKIRRYEPLRDRLAVVNLVERAFELQHDPDGQAMLRQMRNDARKQTRNALLNLMTGGTEGFIWEADGKLVGNITLIPFQSGFKPITLVANVAVEKEWQGRGIGTELTRHALRVARQMPLGEIWLQVRSEKKEAIRMDESLGFKKFSALSQWRRPARKDDYCLSRKYSGLLFRRRVSDWPVQSKWLEAAYPKPTRWYASFDFNLLKPYAWINPLNWVDLMALKTCCLRSDAGMVAALSCHSSPRYRNRLWLAVDRPSPDDEKVRTLLEAFLENEWDGGELLMEYPLGWATEAIASAGFVNRRDLDWMRFEG